MKRDILGIVGGLGPLASAEFVKTIYECGQERREQDCPVVVMQSDPSFPDRTQFLLEGKYESLLSRLTEVILGLRKLGANRIVICCITIHYLLPKLAPELRRPVISLLDVIFALVAESRRRHLLISTTGARKLGIYECHAQWQHLRDRIILPDESDQVLIHNGIYQIKRDRDIRKMIPLVETLLPKYDTDSFIAGCTEIHLLAKHFASSRSGGCHGCIDPLMAVAKDLAQGGLWSRCSEQ
jgi:aspartate racemase